MSTKWQKYRLLRSFDSKFQNEAMVDNMYILLCKQAMWIQEIEANLNTNEEKVYAKDKSKANYNQIFEQNWKTLNHTFYSIHGLFMWDDKE